LTRKSKKQQVSKRERGVASQQRPSLSREAVFQSEFREDLQYWVTTDSRTAKRVLDLVEDVMRDPFIGIGKPEPLKYFGTGVWSRRITQEHRLVYMVKEDRIDFLMCKYHY
jgi:toxin YoeB